MPDASPRPRRSPGADNRQQDADRSRRLLLEAALDEFAAKGYAGARVHEIAARAGVNKQLINYYFDSKAGLYRELQRTWRRREETFADPTLPLHELAVRYLHDALAEPRLTRLMAWRGLSDPGGGGIDGDGDGIDGDEADGDGAENPDLLDPPQPGDSAGYPDLADFAGLRARQAAGELDNDVDLAGARLAIMGAVMIPVIMPHLVRRVFGLDPADPEFEARYGAALREFIRRLGPSTDAAG